MSRTITKTVKYYDFKNFVHQLELLECVEIEKGEYHADTKEIDLIITFNDFFLSDHYCDILNHIRSEQISKIREKFNNTPDKNIIFTFEAVKMMKALQLNFCDDEKDNETWLVQRICTPDVNFDLEQIQKKYDKGRITETQYNAANEILNKNFIIGGWINPVSAKLYI